MNLEYGMKLMVKMPKVNWIPTFGIGLTSSDDKEYDVECIVSKYWSNDTDANAYKVKLIPSKEEDLAVYGIRKVYCSDLKTSLQNNSSSYKLI
jgi:hypothetical protein